MKHYFFALLATFLCASFCATAQAQQPPPAPAGRVMPFLGAGYATYPYIHLPDYWGMQDSTKTSEVFISLSAGAEVFLGKAKKTATDACFSISSGSVGELGGTAGFTYYFLSQPDFQIGLGPAYTFAFYKYDKESLYKKNVSHSGQLRAVANLIIGKRFTIKAHASTGFATISRSSDNYSPRKIVSRSGSGRASAVGIAVGVRLF
ncbi:MAG: hypothetical protein IPL35_03515 [Sphingobacteriales bacterium]|nr:hypothetical protein [Sphingobacteriales bacterium]